MVRRWFAFELPPSEEKCHLAAILDVDVDVVAYRLGLHGHASANARRRRAHLGYTPQGAPCASPRPACVDLCRVRRGLRSAKSGAESA